MFITKLKIDKKFETKNIINNMLKIDSDTKRNVIKKSIKSRLKTTYIYIYEEYYLRTNSDLTVTIFIEEEENSTNVELISSGGGVGMMSNSFGSEAKSLKELKNELISYGFKEYD